MRKRKREKKQGRKVGEDQRIDEIKKGGKIKIKRRKEKSKEEEREKREKI